MDRLIALHDTYFARMGSGYRRLINRFDVRTKKLQGQLIMWIFQNTNFTEFRSYESSW